MIYPQNGVASANEKNKILSLEAYIMGSSPSYIAFIDLQKKIATYKNLEGSYQVIGDKEIGIDNTMIKKFQIEMDSIRIWDWDEEYFTLVLDGISWSVTIKTVSGVLKSSGSNAFPKNWGKFCRSIESIFKSEF